MKKVLLLVGCSLLLKVSICGICNTLPQTCATACNLGTLPAPAPCNTNSDSINPGTAATFSLTNIGSIAGDPKTIITGCAYPGADVWYTFTATGNQLVILLTSDPNHPLNNPNINLYSGNSCSTLNPVTCFTGSGGTLTATYQPITLGTTYYMQISGNSLTDQGNFTLQLQNNLDCSKCVLGENITATPPPVNGTYTAGQTVQFCFTVNNYNQNSSNWLHGVVPSFGAGWDQSTFTSTSVPPSCSPTPGAYWAFYQSDSSFNSGLKWGPGFFYETSAGSPNDSVDNIPGDNYGDNGAGDGCDVTFCWQITTRKQSTCINGGSLSVKVTTTGDSESGSWVNTGCANDPIFSAINATLSCCLPPVVSAVNTSCGAHNGIAIAAAQGTGPWTYAWTNSSGVIISYQTNLSIPDTIRNLPAGQYFVADTDASGCSGLGVANVGGLKDSFTLTVDSISCATTSPVDGKIIVTPLTTQDEPYTYSINGASPGSNNTFTGLSAGTYTIITKNTFGCPDTLSAVITLPPPIILGSPVIVSAGCSTGGSVSVPASGGTGTLSYNWSNSHSGNPQTNLAGGVYHLTVTDQRSCTDTASFTVGAAVNALSFGTASITNVTCFNGSNGSISTSVTGGTGKLAYHWSNNFTTASISGLIANTYSITVTDSLGCSASTSYIVTQPTQISLANTVIKSVSCASGGAIDVTPTGGNSPYSYSWSPTHSGDSITNLASGTYKLTVTDKNSCSATASYTVSTAPNTFTISNATIHNDSCHNKQDGSIAVTTVGGSPPVHYQWNVSPSDTTSTISNLAAGTNYKVTVTDALGCVDSAAYSIINPAAISLGSATITAASCTTGGSIFVQGFGGTGTLNFQWNPTNQTGDFVVNLAGGTYSVTVTDQNGCSVSAAFNVGAPNSAVTLDTPQIVNVKCHGDQNGSISAKSSGGTGSIHYVWSNNATGSTISGLSANFYSVTATDSLGCSATATYSVTQPNALSLGNAVIIGSSCATKGSIKVIASGGTGNLTYKWSNAVTGDSIGGLAAANFTLTVTDQNLCSITASYSVPSLGGISFADPVITNVSCNGGNNGSITASASGGTGTLKYNWGGSNTTATITGLVAGSYSVTVTDANNCSASITYIVNQPAALVANVNYRSFICYGFSSDTLTADPTGGNPGYQYRWNNNATTASVVLPAGNFSVTVTDTKSCTAVFADSIRQDRQISNTNILTLHRCSSSAHGDLQLDGTGGTGALTYVVAGIGTNTSGSFPNLSPGSYAFTIIDTAGCYLFPPGSGEVTIPNSIASDSFHITADSTTCYGFNDGQIIITPENPGDGPFVYQVDGGQFLPTDTFTDISGGPHEITVKNVAFGCLYNYNATVPQPLQHLVSINPDTVMTLPGKMDTVTVTTDFPNPVYTWSPVAGLSCDTCRAPVITADTNNTAYFVKVYSVSDSSCYSTDSVIVIVAPPQLPDSFIMPSAFTPNGDGKNDYFEPIISINYTNPTIKTFRIYNRWGQMVHNANTKWDGKFNGKEQPVGTYIYYIEVEYANRANSGTSTYKKEGSVTLLR